MTSEHVAAFVNAMCKRKPRRGEARWLLLLALLSCSRAEQREARSDETRTSIAPLSASAQLSAAAENRPTLVLVVIVDQLARTELLRAEPWLSPNGGLRRAIEKGVYFERGRYPYAGTLTAPGHAALSSGAAPTQSGVSANEHYNYESKAVRGVTFDPAAKVLGSAQTSGPALLKAETVAEVLSRETGGKGQALAFSLKDRGAIFSLGRAGRAYWFDTAQQSFTTASSYANELPPWLLSYQRQHPFSALLVPWLPLNAALYQQVQGSDDGQGEVNIQGFGKVFPHDPKQHEKPQSLLKSLPALGDALFSVAEHAISEEKLGQDEVPDLLVVSVSGLDYAGHSFGPRSWEYLDHLLRIDQRLGTFLQRVEQKARVVTLISADHGVAPLPESMAKQAELVGKKGGRLFTSALQRDLNKALQQRFGKGEWVAALLGAFVYLTPEARARNDIAELRSFAASWLEQQPGVARALIASALRGKDAEPGDSLEKAVALSLGADVDVDLYLVQEPYFVMDGGEPPGAGSHHGSPYDYDREVPVLIVGHGIEPRRVKEAVDVLRVAPTLAALLGISRPRQAELPSLLE